MIIMKFVVVSLLNLGFLLCWVVAKPNAGVINVLPRHSLKTEENGLEIEITPTNGPWTHGIIGMSLPSAVGYWENCETEGPDDYLCVHWGDFATVHLRAGKDPSRCTRVEWTSTFAREIEDCYDLDPQVHWYGGGEMYTQIWPIETRPRKEGPYVTADAMADFEGEFGGVLENYWLLSSGAALIIDPDTPLHFSLNSTHPNRVCFVSRDHTPFTKRSPLTMNYEWCTGTNVKDAHQFAMSTFFGKPTGIPDEEMLVRPLWSTWAEYKLDVNQSIVLDFAREVVNQGFGNASHIEIDDFWEPCYGEEVFDPAKFPNPREMINEIKDMNMRVTMWVHPFVNYGCPLFDEGFQKGYFVKTPRGKTGITSWWRGQHSGIIDVTNPEATQWWVNRLRKLQDDTGVDSYKFDAGETNWLPSAPALEGDDTSMWPQLYSTKFVETCVTFGGMIETRTAHLNQKLPFFVRTLDKDSRWGYNNGLKSMIPTILQFGIVGYPFVLPDMIGGNAYDDGLPSKELYVRWMQVNIFMPAMQFSIVPWKYDAETVQICLDVLAQREKYRENILTAARQVVIDGTPVNRPIWWTAPNDIVTHTIDDAYMLGDSIMVAPVLEEGAVTRDIYLPEGTWVSGVDSNVYTGPQWLRDYPAPLNVVPFFIKSD